MAKLLKFEDFEFLPDDPLASEHMAVAKWLEDVVAFLGHNIYFQHVDPKSFPSGKKLLDADREQTRRYVLAAVAQVRHWDQLAEQIHAYFLAEADSVERHPQPGWQPLSELDRMKAHLPREWYQVRGKRSHLESLIGTLMRRALPFQKNDLLAILHWCAEGCYSQMLPLTHIVRALKRYASQMPLDVELCVAKNELAMRLRSSPQDDVKQLGTLVEQIGKE